MVKYMINYSDPNRLLIMLLCGEISVMLIFH